MFTVVNYKGDDWIRCVSRIEPEVIFFAKEHTVIQSLQKGAVVV